MELFPSSRQGPKLRYEDDLVPVEWLIVLGDHEKAAINAFNEIIPQVQFRMCHFHLCQAIFRNLMRHGLHNAYVNPLCRLRFFVRNLYALAFLPFHEVNAAYADLIDPNGRFSGLMNRQSNPDYDSFRKFLTYYEREWMDDEDRRREWNMFDEEDHRTNNDVEGWHSWLRNQSALGASRPNLYKFLKFINGEQQKFELKYEKYKTNHPQPLRRKSQNEKEKRIKLAKDRYARNEINRVEFLHSIALVQANFEAAPGNLADDDNLDIIDANDAEENEGEDGSDNEQKVDDSDGSEDDESSYNPSDSDPNDLKGFNADFDDDMDPDYLNEE